MSRGARARVLKAGAAALGLVLVIGLAAPYISASSYGGRLRVSLERSLGRRVEVRGPVRFTLFQGPGFSAESVVIHEDPSLGFEPMAYVDKVVVRPSLWSLLTGRLAIASIRLEDADINLAKNGGTWNFTSFVNRSVMSTAPAIHVRNGRINFKSGDTKSIFYLMRTDLDVSPPGSLGGGWSVRCEAQAGRTDKPALGLGSFSVNGKWYLAPERVDLDVRLDPTQIGEFAVLMSGQAGGVHGIVSSRLRLAGPLNGIGILGRLRIEDVHRWDLLPPKGQGWPMDIRGRLDLTGQQLELVSTSSVVPLTTRFRANDYLSHPRWAVAMTWNGFPVGPVLQVARDMGAPLPQNFQMNGAIDGAVSYAGPSGFQGELVLHDTAITIPDSPPIRFDQMRVMLDHDRIWLPPADVHTNDDDARIEAKYSMGSDVLDLAISTGEMKVASLRAQVALAAVPWLDQVNSGTWSGQLHYHREPEDAAWTGTLQLADAEAKVPGLAGPVGIASARVAVDGDRVVVDRINGQAGKIAFTGDYRYEPHTARPHRLMVRATEVDAEELEKVLMPTLRRSSSLLARAFGRASLPEWLRERKLEGSVQIRELRMAGAHVENVRARLLWDVDRVHLVALAARMGRAAIDGSLGIQLNGSRPVYTLEGKLHGFDWQSGKLDATGTLTTSGTGAQLMANLKSEGAFTGTGLDFGTLSGDYTMAWAQSAPSFRLTSLSLRSEDETYTGRGATQEDGRLVILLTNGSKEMRVSGTVASLKADAEAGQPNRSQ